MRELTYRILHSTTGPMDMVELNRAIGEGEGASIVDELVQRGLDAGQDEYGAHVRAFGSIERVASSDLDEALCLMAHFWVRVSGLPYHDLSDSVDLWYHTEGTPAARRYVEWMVSLESDPDVIHHLNSWLINQNA